MEISSHFFCGLSEYVNFKKYTRLFFYAFYSKSCTHQPGTFIEFVMLQSDRQYNTIDFPFCSLYHNTSASQIMGNNRVHKFISPFFLYIFKSISIKRRSSLINQICKKVFLKDESHLEINEQFIENPEITIKVCISNE